MFMQFLFAELYFIVVLLFVLIEDDFYFVVDLNRIRCPLFCNEYILKIHNNNDVLQVCF